MAFLDQEYTTDNLPQSEKTYEPLPAGMYQAVIAGAELKSTKAGNGQYIAVRYDITGPTHQGRVVYGNINIKNPNPEAERIGREQLGELMRAIGLSRVSDTDQLIGGTLEIKLSIKKDAEYGERNEVKGFKSLTGSLPAPQGSVFGAHVATGEKNATVQQSAPAKSTPPWAKK